VINLDEYNLHGYTVIENAMSGDDLKLCRHLGLKLRNWVSDKVGTPCKFGPTKHWKGVACAGMYESELYDLYTSRYMYKISSKLLGAEPYLFNDQMVYKLPEDGFGFAPHYDNQYGPNKNVGVKTINFSIILDDFTDENGALMVKSQRTLRWKRIYPKAGDIVAIEGNTYHASSENKSKHSRGLYACVYSDTPIVLDNFYVDKFISK
tara:strand:- start:40514 stop:41134 length:621 start_codon:yes stop_codon:yes gene_type:complete